jgi:hypothetical protein
LLYLNHVNSIPQLVPMCKAKHSNYFGGLL